MSVGELTNLYRDGELIIRPEFQRFYRWTSEQRSRLVESLLLGIPLPSIFVAQGAGGTWEIVDGLQRISTILELQGVLVQDGKKLPPLTLVGTKYLPALEGRQWEHKDVGKSLTSALRLDVKRTKLDVKIIKRDSSPDTKFDLFQRLNSYGSTLTAQEIRSAMLVGTSPDFFNWLEALARYPAFSESVGLSERLVAERYDLELALRFLVLHRWPEDQLKQSLLRDFSSVLDRESISIATRHPKDAKKLERIFKSTFDYIGSHGADDVFKRYDSKAAAFRGSFLNTAFEIFALGAGYNVSKGIELVDNLLEVAAEVWGTGKLQRGYATGRSTEARLVEFIPLGRQVTALVTSPSQALRRTAPRRRRPRS